MSVNINHLLSEAELVQATLRNCSIGIQIEKDCAESKRRWSQEKDEEQKNNSSGGKNQPNRLMLLDPTSNSQCNCALQVTIVLNPSFFNAVINTGSNFSLLQQ